MAETQETVMENLTDELQSGALTNPNPNALLKGDDLKGGDMTVTIRAAQKRVFAKGTKDEEVAWVLLFNEIDAGVKLNKTRTEQLFSIMGSNQIDHMIGRLITIAYDPNVMMAGRKVGGVCFKKAEEGLV